MRPVSSPDGRRAEAGFALPMTLLMTFVCGLIAIAVLTAATNDLPSARADQDRRTALDAAQAGVAWYSSRLQADPAYWSKCANVPAPDTSMTRAPVRDRPLAPGAAEDRTWRLVPGTTQQYTVELLPAAGYAACDPANASKSMLTAGSLRIRVTGRLGTTGRKRSLITTFRKSTFLNYVYYTKYEVQDPDTDGSASTTTAATSCGQPISNNGDVYSGSIAKGCSPIQWFTGDKVKGPFHTEDGIITCGSPVFGRAGQAPPDRIEVADPAGNYDLGGSGCNGDPTFAGTYIHPAGPVNPPPDNGSLASIAQPPYVLTGRSKLELGVTAGKITITSGGTTTTVDYPPNGLIWVGANASGACPQYTPRARYDTTDTACGTVDVSGTYDRDLTIAAANDVLIVGNLTRSASAPTAMLGLVANSYVRVRHPVALAADGTCTKDSANTAGTALNNLKVDAGILAVQHSFIVDNYDCGAGLGTLNVTGAIAQKFRGPVATSGGTGYVKNYDYNDDFAFREPPNFLDPVESAWIPVRQNEQFPAS